MVTFILIFQLQFIQCVLIIILYPLIDKLKITYFIIILSQNTILLLDAIVHVDCLYFHFIY